MSKRQMNCVFQAISSSFKLYNIENQTSNCEV